LWQRGRDRAVGREERGRIVAERERQGCGREERGRMVAERREAELWQRGERQDCGREGRGKAVVERGEAGLDSCLYSMIGVLKYRG